MEAHLALLGWVPFDWAQAAAYNPLKNDIVVWLNWQRGDDGDWFGWTKRSMLLGKYRAVSWAEDDKVFWQLAIALIEDERFQ